MARNQIQPSENQSRQIKKRFSLLGYYPWGLLLLYLVSVWIISGKVDSVSLTLRTLYVGIMIVQIILSILMVWCLSIISKDKKWNYRLAYVCSFGAGILYWFISKYTGPLTSSIEIFITYPILYFAAIFLSVILGAFVGCLIATALFDELWEDNPPSEEIQVEVLKLHRSLNKNRYPIPKIKRVVVGNTAPIIFVNSTKRSYHSTRIINKTPVRSHNHEYSSLSFPLLTRCKIVIKMMLDVRMANIFCGKVICRPPLMNNTFFL